MIAVGSKVTPVGGGDNAEIGTVVETWKGRRALVDWPGIGKMWATLHSLQPAAPTGSTPAGRSGVNCDECGRFIPGATIVPSYCHNC